LSATKKSNQTRAKPRAGSREDALDQLASAFKGAMVAIRRLRGRDTHRHDELSFAQYQLLFGLADRDELPAGELALSADLSPAATTQLLDTLATNGLVERNRSERDRRVVTCRLTPHGRELVNERRASFERRWQSALARFNAKDIATAAAVIQQLRTLYEDLDREPTEKPPS
jgi:DNA-binding MarR family transcriptional regulator